MGTIAALRRLVREPIPWDLVQGVLVAGIIGAGLTGRGWPRLVRRPLRLAALVAALPAGWLFASGMLGLGDELTSAPEPIEGATLRRQGAFGLVRHPMYGGVLLLVLAWALASSPVALAPGSAGVAFLGVKVRREEELLREEFADYDDYARDVPKRFVPYVV